MRAVYFIGYSLLCTERCVMVVISEEREAWEHLRRALHPVLLVGDL
jgi:hypothetical protein